MDELDRILIYQIWSPLFVANHLMYGSGQGIAVHIMRSVNWDGSVIGPVPLRGCFARVMGLVEHWKDIARYLGKRENLLYSKLEGLLSSHFVPLRDFVTRWDGKFDIFVCLSLWTGDSWGLLLPLQNDIFGSINRCNVRLNKAEGRCRSKWKEGSFTLFSICFRICLQPYSVWHPFC